MNNECCTFQDNMDVDCGKHGSVINEPERLTKILISLISLKEIDPITKTQNETNNVVQALIYKVVSNKNYTKLHERIIHKALFKLKISLPEDNIIKDYLPFYWQSDGPFSDVVKENVERMEIIEILERYNIKIPIPNIDGFGEALKNLVLILEDLYPKNYDAIVEDIYREYAPYSFMVTFRFDFITSFKSYIEKKLSEQSDTGTTIDKLEYILYNCESELLLDPLFRSFNTSFSSFVTNANIVFDYIRENDNIFLLYELLADIAEIIWDTFSQGVRILDKCHDKYYNTRLVYWKKEYNKSLHHFYRSLYEFNSIVLRDAKMDVSCVILEEKLKKLLPSIIDVYFKEAN